MNQKSTFEKTITFAFVLGIIHPVIILSCSKTKIDISCHKLPRNSIKEGEGQGSSSPVVEFSLAQSYSKFSWGSLKMIFQYRNT